MINWKGHRLVVAASRSGLPLVLAAALAGWGCEASTGLARDNERLIQTESLAYDLRSDGLGLRVEIGYVFTNRTGATVYLVNCRGAFALRLEREVEAVWRTAWGPVLNQCLSPPIVIESGATFVDTLHVWGGPPGSNSYPQFDTDDPSGTYRIVWEAALSSYQDRLPFGPQIPLEARISNRFTLRMR